MKTKECKHRQTCGGNCMICGEKGVHARRNLEVELERILDKGLLSQDFTEIRKNFVRNSVALNV